jgi:hypothetical protein
MRTGGRQVTPSRDALTRSSVVDAAPIPRVAASQTPCAASYAITGSLA